MANQLNNLMVITPRCQHFHSTCSLFLTYKPNLSQCPSVIVRNAPNGQQIVIVLISNDTLTLFRNTNRLTLSFQSSFPLSRAKSFDKEKENENLILLLLAVFYSLNSLSYFIMLNPLTSEFSMSLHQRMMTTSLSSAAAGGTIFMPDTKCELSY